MNESKELHDQTARDITSEIRAAVLTADQIASIDAQAQAHLASFDTQRKFERDPASAYRSRALGRTATDDSFLF